MIKSRDTCSAAKKPDSPSTLADRSPSCALAHGRHGKHEAVEIVLPGSLSRTASEDKYVSLYWDLFLPKCRDRTASREWARSSQSLFRTEPALRSAVLAVSLGMLGEKEDCQWMRQEGLKAYGRALLEETAALRSPFRVKSDAVLLAAKFMTTYEMLFGARTGNLLELSHRWRSHNVGSLAIMEARTPWSAVEGDGHHIFLDSRLFWVSKRGSNRIKGERLSAKSGADNRRHQTAQAFLVEPRRVEDCALDNSFQGDEGHAYGYPC